MNRWFWPSMIRELRSSWARLSLSALCLFLATTSLTSIILTDTRLSQQTKRQADTILGGDVEIFDVRLLPESLLERIQSSPDVERKTRITSFITLVSPAAGGRPRVVEALAVDDSWPLVPGVKVTPSDAFEHLRKGGVWVEKSLAENLGLQLSLEKSNPEQSEKSLQRLYTEKKAVRVGKKLFPIIGFVENDQMRDFASFALGARIYFSRETATKNRFISAQSRLRDKYLIRFAPSLSFDAGKKWIQSELDKLGPSKPSMRNKEDALNGVFKPAKSLFLFYDAIGFSLLILLGLGCAQGIHSYLNRKYADAQILQMLGAQRDQVALLFIGQVFVVTIVAIALGAWCGFYAFEEFLVPRLSLWTPGLSSEITFNDFGVTSLRFAAGLFVLISALLLPGALLFFHENKSSQLPHQHTSENSKPKHKQQFNSIVQRLKNFPDMVWLFATFLLSFLISDEVLLNLVMVIFLSAIYLLVRACISTLSQLGLSSRFRLPLFLKLASSEIGSRPTQSALSLLLICLSVCLVVFLWNLRTNIVTQLTDGFANGIRPNVFILDSPPDSVQNIKKILQLGQAENIWTEKLTRARIESINDKTPEEWSAQLKPSETKEKRTDRMLNREQNLTTRAELGIDEELVAGQFWAKDSIKKPTNEVSVEIGLANLLNLNIGDLITFNVQGVPVKVKVSSLRRVRWQSFKPNFFFILHPSMLEEAPYSALIAATIQNTQNRNDTMSLLFKNHPGLTSIDANEFSQLAGKIISAALDIVRVLSIMLFAGALLNASLAAWTSFNTRAKHFSLYRCLGATNKLVMGSCLAEFLVISALGSVIGLVASQALSMSVERLILTIDDQLNLSILPSLSVGMIVISLSLIIGSISAFLILRQPPLRVLRRAN